MTKARTLADLLDSSGDVKSSALDNATSSLSDLSVTATASELNTLDGITATTTELNYLDGVTSNVQTQIDGISSEVVDDTTPSLGGDLSTNGNDVNFGDNDKAQFGAGNDLQIYHNGTDSFIDEVNSTGWLYIRGNNTVIGKHTGETYFKGIADGAAELYHDNSLKFSTTANGIETRNGTDISMSASGDGQLKIDGNGYAGAIALDGSNMNIYTNSASRGIVFGTNETERMRINADGSWGKAPAGTVLQVVQLHYPGNSSSGQTHQLSSTSSTFQDFLSKSITTKAANSKIYVTTYSMHYQNNFINGDGRLLRNSTQIDYCRYQLYQNDAAFLSFGFQMLDSPNVAAGTTLTYKHQLNSRNGASYFAGYGDSSGKVNSNMILMEIAG